jgi:hypothetical protein
MLECIHPSMLTCRTSRGLEPALNLMIMFARPSGRMYPCCARPRSDTGVSHFMGWNLTI